MIDQETNAGVLVLVLLAMFAALCVGIGFLSAGLLWLAREVLR